MSTVRFTCLLTVFCLCGTARINAQGIITTIAGNGITQYIGEGSPATAYSLALPAAVCVDKNGKVYVANNADNLIMTVYHDTLRTIVGDTSLSGSSDSGDGHQADSAQLRNPNGLCLDTAGNIYIAEWYNDLIRKVDAHTGIITTICGVSGSGFGGDNGPATAAQLSHPHGICADPANNLYIADYDNQRIRKINLTTGNITTIAGTGANGYSGDNGPATSAALSYPNSVSADTSGNIFFAETGNNTIRRINAATGVITTIAGSGPQGFSPDGTAATSALLNQPNAVFADKYGYIYISDYGNDIIRTISPDGLIYTIAGTGAHGYSGDEGRPLDASFRGPTALCTDDSGYIYIADGTASVIRKMSPIIVLKVGVKNIAIPSFNIYPNPSTGKFTITPAQDDNATITIVNTIGQLVFSARGYGKSMTIDLSGHPPGMYFVHYVTTSGETTTKVMIY